MESKVFAVHLSVLDDSDAFAKGRGGLGGMPEDPDGLFILSYPCFEPCGFSIHQISLYLGQLPDPLETEADEEDKTDLDWLVEA
jgi:hypothetical protein